MLGYQLLGAAVSATSTLHERLITSTCLMFAMILSLAMAVGASGTTAERDSFLLLEGTRWETPCYVQETGRDGPTVMIVGGIHGNEPAGAAAAEQIRHWPITRGRMIVVPRANVPALAANRRFSPQVDHALRDLNRNFPRDANDDPPRDEPAKALWKLIGDHQPDWLLDLHEGYDFHLENPDSIGSTIIRWRTPEADRVGRRMVEAVNATIDMESRKFQLRAPPAQGAMARAAGEHAGIQSLILETTRKDQPLSLRTRQHRIMVHRLLDHLEMIDDPAVVNMLANRESAGKLTLVALYDGVGIAGPGVSRCREQLDDRHFLVVHIGPADIREGALEPFDVVMFTGGAGRGQAQAIGDEGRRAVRQFVESGGGFIGICAGAYLALDGSPAYGLGIIRGKTVSSHWRRGNGEVEMELTALGREVFGDLPGRFKVRYVNGPIIKPSTSDVLEDFQPLAHFRTELAAHGAPRGIMVDSPAIAAGRFGRGKVISISPHPEQTEHLVSFVPQAVRWVAADAQVAAER